MPWYRPMRKNRLPIITQIVTAATIIYVTRLKMMDCFRLDDRMRINTIGFVCFHYVPSASTNRVDALNFSKPLINSFSLLYIRLEIGHGNREKRMVWRIQSTGSH